VETPIHSNKERQMKTFTVSEQVKKGIVLKYKPEGSSDLLGVAIGQGILKEMRDAFAAGYRESTWQWLDVVPDAEGNALRLIKEQNARDKRALVLVETPPGVGGSVKLFANTITEVYDEQKGRVTRTANPFPPPGVKLLAEKPADGVFGPEFLIEMAPGSSFRIVRSGKLYDHTEKRFAPPELVVVWNGRWDRRAEFDRFRNPDPKKYKEFIEGKLRRSDFDKNEWDSFRYKQNPMAGFWGLSVYHRSMRHGDV
jgi:hypothetical protein